MRIVSEISQPYKGTLELPGDVYERLAALVAKRRTTIKAIVAEAVQQYLSTSGEPSHLKLVKEPSVALSKLARHPRLLELLADANPEDFWKLEGYLEGRREVRKKKSAKE